MQISKLKAMRVFARQFGECSAGDDFAGRTIMRENYNDIGHVYGWVVIPIVPEFCGGTDSIRNLICVHYTTAQERDNKFPTFNVNGVTYEVKYRGMRYMIERRDGYKKDWAEDMKKVDFMNATSGTRFFKKLKGIQNQPRFVGTILIRVQNMKNTAVVDFIEKYFETENISYSMNKDYEKSETRILAKDYNLPYQDDTQKLLNKCIVLNTYMQKYFVPIGFVGAYDIFFRCDYYQMKSEMYVDSQDLSMDDIIKATGGGDQLHNCLFISKNVVHNTSASKTITASDCDEYTAYDGIYSYLGDELQAEARKEK